MVLCAFDSFSVCFVLLSATKLHIFEVNKRTTFAWHATRCNQIYIYSLVAILIKKSYCIRSRIRRQYDLNCVQYIESRHAIMYSENAKFVLSRFFNHKSCYYYCFTLLKRHYLLWIGLLLLFYFKINRKLFHSGVPLRQFTSICMHLIHPCNKFTRYQEKNRET